MNTNNGRDFRKKLALLFEDSDDEEFIGMSATTGSLSAQPSGLEIDRQLVELARPCSDDEHCSSHSKLSSLENNPYLAGFMRSPEKKKKKRGKK